MSLKQQASVVTHTMSNILTSIFRKSIMIMSIMLLLPILLIIFIFALIFFPITLFAIYVIYQLYRHRSKLPTPMRSLLENIAEYTRVFMVTFNTKFVGPLNHLVDRFRKSPSVMSHSSSTMTTSGGSPAIYDEDHRVNEYGQPALEIRLKQDILSDHQDGIRQRARRLYQAVGTLLPNRVQTFFRANQVSNLSEYENKSQHTQRSSPMHDGSPSSEELERNSDISHDGDQFYHHHHQQQQQEVQQQPPLSPQAQRRPVHAIAHSLAQSVMKPATSTSTAYTATSLLKSDSDYSDLSDEVQPRVTVTVSTNAKPTSQPVTATATISTTNKDNSNSNNNNNNNKNTNNKKKNNKKKGRTGQRGRV